jgi:thiol-disulfide isomerase/thioredoxin
MSGLLFLSSDDFVLSKGTKGNILCTSIPGFSLILFYSTQCPHCQNLLPIFKRLPGSINGCQFGIINVSTNKTCIRLSKDTISPITYVPYIILYINGRPFLRYSGPPVESEIRRFVFEVAQKVQSKQKFSNEQVKEDVRGHIPAFTIGIPKCDEDVCYLEFDDAYDKHR